MDERTARTIAKANGGEYWHSGGNIWLVRWQRVSGAVICLSDDCVCEYRDMDAYYGGEGDWGYDVTTCPPDGVTLDAIEMAVVDDIGLGEAYELIAECRRNDGLGVDVGPLAG
jgi:hypothetical protein